MYGTIAIMKPKAGSEAALTAMFDKWWTERRPKVKGAIASSVHKNEKNPAEVIVAVIFDSKESYTANAGDPDQDKWYQEMRALLESDPHWIDGDVLAYKHV